MVFTYLFCICFDGESDYQLRSTIRFRFRTELGSTVHHVLKMSTPGFKDRDLKTKYEEIRKYADRVDEKKKWLETELKRAKASGGGASRAGGYQLWHIVLAVIMAILSVKVAEKYKLVK